MIGCAGVVALLIVFRRRPVPLEIEMVHRASQTDPLLPSPMRLSLPNSPMNIVTQPPSPMSSVSSEDFVFEINENYLERSNTC